MLLSKKLFIDLMMLTTTVKTTNQITSLELRKI